MSDEVVKNDSNPYPIIATTMHDAILTRIVAYTPVNSAEKAVVLAYTIRQFNALHALVVDHGLSFEIDHLVEQLDTAVEVAKAYGFTIPQLS